MAELARQKCTACRRDSPRVTEAEARELLPQIPHWELIEEEGVRKLRRAFRFRNFRQALDFTVAVGELAEEEGHHPLLITEWGRVTVVWWTHKIRGLHLNDFVMSAKTDEAYRRMTEQARD